MHNTYSLKGKTVLITGANGQIGSRLVERFLQEGAFVHVTDIHPSISPKLKRILSKRGLRKFKYHTLDVTHEKSIRTVMNSIQLDVLVNNAGIAVFTPFEERSEEEIDAVNAVNIKGTTLCAKVGAENMARRGGRIINIGSIYGVVAADKKIYGDSGRNSSDMYAATKAGVIHLTKYLAAYLADKKITVNSISPGGVFANQKKVFLDNYIEKTPLGRMAEPDDIANAVLFLASPDAAYITGQNLTVDGGFTLNQ